MDDKKEKISEYKRRIMETDPYWKQPLPYRIYQRVLFAIMGGIVVGCIFDCLGAPFPLQIAMCIITGIGVLLFRMAYPAGFSGFFNRMMEEASKANENNANMRK